MVQCSNLECPLGRWYHVSCVELRDVPAHDDDWWCYQDCKDSGSSAFCICRKQAPGEATVTCARGADCEGGTIFHLKCVGIDPHNVPGEHKVLVTYLCTHNVRY